MRIAWRTVGAICERVAVEGQRQTDLLDGLRRIGIDEISHRKGQRYTTRLSQSVDRRTGSLHDHSSLTNGQRMCSGCAWRRTPEGEAHRKSARREAVEDRSGRLERSLGSRIPLSASCRRSGSSCTICIQTNRVVNTAPSSWLTWESSSEGRATSWPESARSTARVFPLRRSTSVL
jgi:hypothetical protein